MTVLRRCVETNRAAWASPVRDTQAALAPRAACWGCPAAGHYMRTPPCGAWRYCSRKDAEAYHHHARHCATVNGETFYCRSTTARPMPRRRRYRWITHAAPCSSPHSPPCAQARAPTDGYRVRDRPGLPRHDPTASFPARVGWAPTAWTGYSVGWEESWSHGRFASRVFRTRYCSRSPSGHRLGQWPLRLWRPCHEERSPVGGQGHCRDWRRRRSGRSEALPASIALGCPDS